MLILVGCRSFYEVPDSVKKKRLLAIIWLSADLLTKQQGRAMAVQEVDDVKIPIADILKRFAQVRES